MMPAEVGQEGSFGDMYPEKPMPFDPLPPVERPHVERSVIAIDYETVPVYGLPIV